MWPGRVSNPGPLTYESKALSTALRGPPMCFLLEILSILKAIKSDFKGCYDKQNLTLVVISYEIYETRQRLVS